MKTKWIALKDQLPPIGVECLGYNPAWINEDYNPKGVRVWFHDDLGCYSAKYNNTMDCWDTTEEEKPTHWTELPQITEPAEGQSKEHLRAAFEAGAEWSDDWGIDFSSEPEKYVSKPNFEEWYKQIPDQPQPTKRTADPATFWSVNSHKYKTFMVTSTNEIHFDIEDLWKFMEEYRREGVPTINANNEHKQCNCAKLNQCYVQDGKTICATCGGVCNISNPTA